MFSTFSQHPACYGIWKSFPKCPFFSTHISPPSHLFLWHHGRQASRAREYISDSRFHSNSTVAITYVLRTVPSQQRYSACVQCWINAIFEITLLVHMPACYASIAIVLVLVPIERDPQILRTTYAACIHSSMLDTIFEIITWVCWHASMDANAAI